MSSPERRKQRQLEWEAEIKACQAEMDRKDALSMYMRIEEMTNPDDVKDILHRIASHVGLE